MWKVVVEIHSFITPTLVEVSSQFDATAALPSGKEPAVGYITGLDVSVGKKSPFVVLWL
jgi:hypothetical protein